MSSNTPYTGSSTAHGSGSYSGSMGGSSDDTVDRMKQGARDAVEQVSEKAGPAMDKLKSGMESVKSSVDEATERVKARAEDMGLMSEDWMRTLRTTVRDHPVASIAVAVAAGMLLSRMKDRY